MPRPPSSSSRRSSRTLNSTTKNSEFNAQSLYDAYTEDTAPTYTIPLLNLADSDSSTHKRSPSDPDPNPPLAADPAQRRHGPTPGLLLPTALVFTITAGFGAALLLWLVTHLTGPPGDVFREGAFLLDEGAKTEGGLEAARLTGLTIASAASSAMGVIAPVSMGLYAYVAARTWLAAGDENLPTAFQYGLLVEMLGGGSLMSLFETGSYLASSSRRPAVPSLFVRVFAVGVATHILAYTASAIDLWLHAVTSTVVQPTSVPVNEPFQFSVAQNTCLPYVPPAAGAFAWPCLLAITRGSWGYGIGALTPGMQVMSNNSGVLQTITLADADDLAVLVDPSAPTNVSFTATTFGARARCDSVNPRCTSPETFNVTCKDVPARFPPLNVTDFDLSDSLSKMSVLSSACDTCPYVNESEYSNGAVTYKTGAPPPQNNYSLWLELIWRNQGSESFDGASKTAADAAYTAFSSEAYMFANCTLLFYNVTLEYANGAYTRAAEVLADAGLADGLVGPTRLGLYGSRLLDNLEGIVFGGNSTAHVMAYLNQDLARLALGSAAYVTNLKGPTLAQSVLSRRILGRYPAWPAVLYVVVLWANAVFPLTVSLVAMLTRTRRIVVAGERQSVTALELAKMRLTRPAALAAELFKWKTDEDGAKASASGTVRGMFDEQRQGEDRVRIGLHERTDGQTVFGVWSRRRGHGRLMDSLGEKECSD